MRFAPSDAPQHLDAELGVPPYNSCHYPRHAYITRFNDRSARPGTPSALASGCQFITRVAGSGKRPHLARSIDGESAGHSLQPLLR